MHGFVRGAALAETPNGDTRSISMIYEYKLIPFDRDTGKPACCPMETPVCMEIDISVLHAMMNKVNPSIMPLPEELELKATISTAARALSEMFGADVLYREQGTEQWQLESAYVPKRKRA